MNYNDNRSNIADMDREAYEQFLAKQCANSVIAESPAPIKETIAELYRVCEGNKFLAYNLGTEFYGKTSNQDGEQNATREDMRSALVCILEICKKTQSVLEDITINITGEYGKSEA